MKYVQIILLILLPISFTHGSPKDDVTRFRTGKFVYADDEKTIVIRTKTTQTEIFNDGKSKLILSVKWLDDYTYELTHKKSVNVKGCLDEGDWIRARITSWEGDRYTCEYTSNKCGSGKSTFIKQE